jgi:hypothetical protein
MSHLDNYNYHRDSRTWDVPSAYTVVESGPDSTKVQLSEDLMESLVDEDIITEHHTGVFDVQTKFEVCGQCSGSGSMVNPAVDAGGLSQEDFDEDPDFREDYFSGRYDVQCSQCKGQRVVPSLTFPKAIQEAIESFGTDAWDSAAECAAERAMGA